MLKPMERCVEEECEAQQGAILVLPQGGGLSPCSRGPSL